MTALASFGGAANVAIIGASGGIGAAFCRRLAADPGVDTVYALSRSEPGFDHERIVWQPIDIEDEASIEYAATAIGEVPFDLVLVTSGILHRGADTQPERRLSELTPENLNTLFAVNTIGPAMVAKHFLPKLRSRSKTVFAALSARVGSISDNRLGGWASYRASKAALNQLLRTIAIEQTRRRPQSIVVSLHPGTVDTPLSQPFTQRTPSEKLFTPDQSAGYLLNVIDGLTAEDSGGFFAWDGARIEY